MFGDYIVLIAQQSLPYLTLSGFVIGLGAVTVIDCLGWLGRHSPYWTEATIRTHKVTKPLIWLGLLIVLVGGTGTLLQHETLSLLTVFLVIQTILVINGLFLSLKVSSHLIAKEAKGTGDIPLTKDWQIMITLSFIISFVGWWSSFVLIVHTLLA